MSGVEVGVDVVELVFKNRVLGLAEFLANL